MKVHPKETKSFHDILIYGEKLFSNSNLYFGHGTTNAWDEAVCLSLHALDLPQNSSNLVLKRILSKDECKMIYSLFDQRVERKIPSAYLTETAWFLDRPFFVDTRVIIPRSPIANLIRAGFEPWIDQPTSILDLCTGSGCIGISCAHLFEEAEVSLSDLSLQALEVAKINIDRFGLKERVSVHLSDLFDDIPCTKFDLIVANPPYVDDKDFANMPDEYSHEPKMSLKGGKDGLKLVKRILRDSAKFLTDKGVLIVEVGNSRLALEQTFPEIAFFWFEFEEGDEGVFMLTSNELKAHSELFK
jgi:ribosomal protein L3 glutamine methyltransferase